MNEFNYSSRHHEIIVCMIFSPLVDEHHVRQGDIHESENKWREEKQQQQQAIAWNCHRFAWRNTHPSTSSIRPATDVSFLKSIIVLFFSNMYGTHAKLLNMWCVSILDGRLSICDFSFNNISGKFSSKANDDETKDTSIGLGARHQPLVYFNFLLFWQLKPFYYSQSAMRLFAFVFTVSQSIAAIFASVKWLAIVNCLALQTHVFINPSYGWCCHTWWRRRVYIYLLFVIDTASTFDTERNLIWARFRQKLK